MNKFLRKSLLAILGGVFFSATAWADETIGAIGTGWAEGSSTAYTLTAGKTLTFTFTEDSKGSEDYFGYVTILAKSSANTWGDNQYSFVRSDLAYIIGGGDWNTGAVSNTSTYESTKPADVLVGATIVQQIKRIGTQVVICSDIRTSASESYRHYYVQDLGTTDDIYAFLAADNAQLTLKSAVFSDTETITGTLLGTETNADTDFGLGSRQDFTMAPNSTLNLHFKNYTNKIDKWNNWAFEMQYGSLFADVVTGGGSWGDLLTGAGLSFEGSTWPSGDNNAFKEALDGADVDMTITRVGSKVTVSAVHTTTVSETFTIVYTFTPTDASFASSDVIVRLLTEGGHLDLLPVSTTIGTTGWATYCNNDYALDFTNVDGLSAYIVTGASGSAITKEAVTKVPAGTPLLLNGTASTTYNIPIIGTYSTDVSANKLKAGTGASVSKESGYDRYVLVASGDKAVFQLINATEATVPTGKAYLEFTATPARETLFLDESDVVTSINAVEAAENNGAVYNLQGQRVERMGKGIYVKDGKKFINK